MTAEKDVLLSLLRLTRAGPVNRSLLMKATRIPTRTAKKALAEFSRAALFKEYRGVIEATPVQRVTMLIAALKLGSDLERVCSLLSWAEFEGVAVQAFEANGFRVIRNFHFKSLDKRWEIDVIGLRKPLILCVDCKHWRRGWQSAATAKAAEAQEKRTVALTKTLPTYKKMLGLEGWQTAKLAPLILSLTQGPYKFYNRVPVVPILQIQDFINEGPLGADFLLQFSRELDSSDSKLTGLAKRSPEPPKQPTLI